MSPPMFMLLCLWCVSSVAVPVTVTIGTQAIHEIDPSFLSLNQDACMAAEPASWATLALPRTIRLASALAPAYFRFGGTQEDWTNYSTANNTATGVAGVQRRVAKLSVHQFDELAEFAAKSGWRLVFGLNALDRPCINCAWNSTNAEILLRHAPVANASTGSVLGWELGNEPDDKPGPGGKGRAIKPGTGLSVAPDVLAKDFATLRRLVGPTGFIAGPDVAGSPSYAMAFCEAAQPNVVNAMTWHHYYGGKPGFPTIADLTSIPLLDSLASKITQMLEATRRCGNRSQPWIGETGASYGDSANATVMDRLGTYRAGFLWLDKLGLSASMGVRAVVRHTLFGGPVGMGLLDRDLNTTPGYWISVLWKRLVGADVFPVTVSDKDSGVRAYAFRARAGAVLGRSAGAPAAVAVVVLNTADAPRVIDFAIGADPHKGDRYEWMLTGGDAGMGSDVYLNSDGTATPLQPDKEGNLPPLLPKLAGSRTAMTIGPFSYAFVVLA